MKKMIADISSYCAAISACVDGEAVGFVSSFSAATLPSAFFCCGISWLSMVLGTMWYVDLVIATWRLVAPFIANGAFLGPRSSRADG